MRPPPLIFIIKNTTEFCPVVFERLYSRASL